MGLYDRDYYRQSLPRGGFGHFDAWSVTTWLIGVNVVVSFVDAGLFRAAHGPPREFYDDRADRRGAVWLAAICGVLSVVRGGGGGLLSAAQKDFNR